MWTKVERPLDFFVGNCEDRAAWLSNKTFKMQQMLKVWVISWANGSPARLCCNWTSILLLWETIIAGFLKRQIWIIWCQICFGWNLCWFELSGDENGKRHNFCVQKYLITSVSSKKAPKIEYWLMKLWFCFLKVIHCLQPKLFCRWNSFVV